jgi:hypothetical protein
MTGGVMRQPIKRAKSKMKKCRAKLKMSANGERRRNFEFCTAILHLKFEILHLKP